MGFWTHLPNADWGNDGWSVVGSSSLWGALDNDNDSDYASCPGSKGVAACSFPTDITAVPAGAVITSIDVFLRVGRGAGVLPADTPASITVSLSCQDDTSLFTARTIYPTSTITTFQVASFKRDVKNLEWDIERINRLLLRLWCYVGVADLIRCYKFYCVINYRTTPTVTVTAPTGTVFTSSPVISWTYAQTDGDTRVKSQYRLFTAAKQADISFDPSFSPPVFDATVHGDVSSVTLPTSIDPDNYWVYVRSWSSFGAVSPWVGRQFTVSGPAPGVPGVPDPTGASLPGVGIIEVVPDVSQGSATLTLIDTSNMLSVQAADAETTSDGSVPNGANCTTTRDTSTSFPGGAASWKLSSTASGDMSITSDWVEVAAQAAITARAQFKTLATTRNCHMSVTYYDSLFNVIGSPTVGTAITDPSGSWNEAVVTDSTPAGVAYMTATATVAATGAGGEVHNVDHFGLMYGTSTPWSDGGHLSRNLLSAWYSTAEGTPMSLEAWNPGGANTVSSAAPPGVGGSGTSCNTMTYAGITPSVAVRGVGTVFTSPTTGSDYTLTTPTASAPHAGDLMLAFVTTSAYGAFGTPPSGWSLVDSAQQSTGGIALHVLKRTAGASEPVSYTGNLSLSSSRRTAVVVVYSGAADVTPEAAAATANTTPTWLTTPTVNATVPNSWRVSAFAVSDDVTGGSLVANVQAPSTVPGIQFVGRSSPWKNTVGGTAYTINRPSGVVSGNLMVATVAISGNCTITAPTGWTKRASAQGDQFTSFAILYRFAGASEPASWTGSASGSINRAAVTQCLAYANVNATTPFLVDAVNSFGSGQTMNTSTVTNTNSSAWRIGAWGAEGDHSDSWTETENVERCDDSAVNSAFFSSEGDSMTVAMADSNGPIGTGSYRTSATLSEGFYGAGSWIGFLNSLASAPAPGGNETTRATMTIGASNPFSYAIVADSGGVISTGNTSVTGSFTAGSGAADLVTAAGWVGIVTPQSAVRNGYVSAAMATTVDITSMDPSLLSLAGNQVTVTAAFIGSTAGTPYLTANFYRANQLISSSLAAGSSFGSSLWNKSTAVFPVPAGTTRMNMGVSASDRNVGDVVYFDRVGVALGNAPAWRSGTSRLAHPVFSVPQIEYADDEGTGYSSWTVLPGTLTNPTSYDDLSGLSNYVDHTVIPLVNRKYRARTLSYGLAGDQFVSSYGPESIEFSFVARNWWLKDIADPSNNLALKVKYDTMTFGTTNTAVAFQALGADLPVVLTEGLKGDNFQVVIVPAVHSDWDQLFSLLRSNRTLFLQSDIDMAWWVRVIGDPAADVLPTDSRQSNPLRSIKVTFVQVASVL